MINTQSPLFVRFVLPLSFVLAGAVLFLTFGGCTSEDTSASSVDVSAVEDNSPRIALDVGIVVTDMEQALGFYRDLLGLPVIAEVRTSLIGAGTMVQLEHGASLIKLLEMDESPLAKTQPGIATTYGHRYITLMVSDIAPYASTLSEAQVPIAMPLTELGNGAKILMVEDPDGNIVEFVQEGG